MYLALIAVVSEERSRRRPTQRIHIAYTPTNPVPPDTETKGNFSDCGTGIILYLSWIIMTTPFRTTWATSAWWAVRVLQPTSKIDHDARTQGVLQPTPKIDHVAAFVLRRKPRATTHDVAEGRDVRRSADETDPLSRRSSSSPSFSDTTAPIIETWRTILPRPPTPNDHRSTFAPRPRHEDVLRLRHPARGRPPPSPPNTRTSSAFAAHHKDALRLRLPPRRPPSLRHPPRRPPSLRHPSRGRPSIAIGDHSLADHRHDVHHRPRRPSRLETTPSSRPCFRLVPLRLARNQLGSFLLSV